MLKLVKNTVTIEDPTAVHKKTIRQRLYLCAVFLKTFGFLLGVLTTAFSVVFYEKYAALEMIGFCMVSLSVIHMGKQVSLSIDAMTAKITGLTFVIKNDGIH